MAVTGVNQLLKDAETFKMEMHKKAMRTLYSNSSAILDAINFGKMFLVDIIPISKNMV